MNYLYAVMGIAMISGIMATLEISASLSNQGLFSKPPTDPYFASNSTAPIVDRAFLKVLTTETDSSWPTGEGFCTKLKEETSKTSNLVSNYTVEGGSASSHAKLLNSCTLIAPNHRIIISYSNPNVNTYGLYSCINSSQLYCNFEE